MYILLAEASKTLILLHHSNLLTWFNVAADRVDIRSSNLDIPGAPIHSRTLTNSSPIPFSRTYYHILEERL